MTQTAPTFQSVFDRIDVKDLNVQFERGSEYVIDGRTYTSKYEQDYDSSIMDDQGPGMWCGQLKYVSGRKNDYGYEVRPVGFDGNSEKLHYGRSYDAVWWQPESDCKPNSDTRASVRQTILDVLENGYVGIVTESEDGEDEAVFGVECTFTGNWHEEIAREQIASLHHTWLADRWMKQWTATDLERALADNDFLIDLGESLDTDDDGE